MRAPVALTKARKNDAELQGMRDAHLMDAVALYSFICWLVGEVSAGVSVTEVEAAHRLQAFRAKK